LAVLTRLLLAPLSSEAAPGAASLVYSEAELLPGDGGPFDQFGFSVAISGDIAVVGAYLHNLVAQPGIGQAYVFGRAGASWTLQATLLASDGRQADRFGASVAISGDTVVIGAPGVDVPGKAEAGQAYVFVRNGTAWTEQARLGASDPAQFDRFGSAVAISGDTVVVGAPMNTPGASGAGRAYVFARIGGAWGEQAKLAPSDGAGGDRFGFSVAIDGDTALAGAPHKGLAGTANTGQAYVFVRSGSAWGEQAKLAASNAGAGDQFGASVALGADAALIGAPHANGAPQAGQAYLFVRSGATWSEQTRLVPSDGVAYDQFGFAVGIAGGMLVVGAPFHDIVGQVYVFAGGGAAWSETRLAAGHAAEDGSFGGAVGISGDTVVVGAPSHSPLGKSGRAYVYDPALKVWIGLRNSDDNGLRFDLRATVLVGATTVAEGEAHDVGGGGGFGNAIGQIVPLALAAGPVIPAGGETATVSVAIRRTCFGSGHKSGTARLWFNGRPIDSGKSRDAASRLHGGILGTDTSYLLRGGFALSTDAGSSRLYIDKTVNSAMPCPGRAFTPFGSWSLTPGSLQSAR
jgi:hypothetical protein